MTIAPGWILFDMFIVFKKSGYKFKVSSIFFLMFIYFERVECEQGKAREGEKENPKQAPCSVWTPTQGSIS